MLKKKELYFHEDDFLQVEIIPSKAIFEKTRNIEDLSYIKNEDGFPIISERGSRKYLTKNILIRSSDLSTYLEDNAIVKYDKLYSGYGSNKKRIFKARAFGYEDYAIVFKYQRKIVTDIWIVYDSELKTLSETYNRFEKTLNQIGEKWNLFLIDWNEEVIIDLNKIKDIKNYINLLD